MPGRSTMPPGDARPVRPRREQFRRFVPITTRWADNDIYGHVNNSVYYFYFDTAVNQYLIEAGALDIHAGAVIGLVVSTACDYFAPVAFPERIEAGLAVEKVGTSSVRYVIGLFRAGEDEGVAAARFTHVYVERDSRRPVPLPDALRAALAVLETGKSEA